MRQRSVRFILLLCILAAAPLSAAEDDGAVYSGRRLSEVLAELQESGLNLVYSSAVIRPELVVLEEPKSEDLRAILDEILAPHGLIARDAPGGNIVIVAAEDGRDQPLIGRLRGVVTASGGVPGGHPVIVTVEGTGIETLTSKSGRFLLDGVPVGRRVIAVSSEGYLAQRLEDVEILPGSTTRVRFDLTPVSIFLHEVVVTPSHIRILQDQPEVRQFLSRQEVSQMPHAADDLYRAVKRLPGTAGGDYSATFNIRGGEQEEVLVILDGVKLYEPYHLKDFQSVFSIIDSEATGGVDFLTGGFPAEYGDRMSGVIDISTTTPSETTSTTLAVSTMNARVLSEGSFNDGRGGWLVSGRAWHPDEARKRVTSSADELFSDYYDLLGKLEHRLGSRSIVSVNLMSAYDDIGFLNVDGPDREQVKARYRSYQLWLNLRTDWSEKLFSRIVLSGGRIRRERDGGVEDVDDGVLTVADDRDFDFIGLRQDWIYELNDRHVVKLGFELESQQADYDYFNRRLVPDSDDGGEPLVPGPLTEVRLRPDGESYGVYAADRFRPAAPLVVELGLRWDKQSWLDDEQLSPRINLMYTVAPRTTLRAAWGRFYQSERLNELQIEDGVTEFFPAQLAEHWLASVEHVFGVGLALRLEGYYKDLSGLRPRYENLFNPLELFPEAQPDRVLIDPDEGRSWGAEIRVKGAVGRRVNWWASYAHANAEDRIDSSWQPRNWDQRHAVTFGVNLELPHRWNINFAGAYHSGFPTTDVAGELVEDEDGELDVELVFGPRNGARYPSYRRFDVRATKMIPTRTGDLTLVFEVLNLFDQKNVCCTDDFEFEIEDDGSVTLIRDFSHWAPLVPTIGVRWNF
jgi:outer membrane receptor protein involved in Fe transport